MSEMRNGRERSILLANLFERPYVAKQAGVFGDGYVAIVARDLDGDDVILDCIGEWGGCGWWDRYTPAEDDWSGYQVVIEGRAYRLVGCVSHVPPGFLALATDMRRVPRWRPTRDPVEQGT